jgi:hypothetical protein
MRLSESYSNYVDHVMRCLNVMVGLKKPLRGLTSAETPRRAAISRLIPAFHCTN